MKDSILIYSGGMDSTTMMYEYRDRIAIALSFDYGSKHNAKELECASWHQARDNTIGFHAAVFQVITAYRW